MTSSGTIDFSISTRKKRKIVLDWLIFLKENDELLFPVHQMLSTEWFELFKSHHESIDHVIFSDIRFFSLQMNNIIRDQSFTYLSKQTSSNPHRVYYSVDTSVENIDDDIATRK